MIIEKLTNKNKERFINSFFKKYKPTEDFTTEEYSKLKILSQWSKLKDLKNLDKLSELSDTFIEIKEKPKFKFLRKDEKCLNNGYIPKTNYGYKNRNKKFTTLFKKKLKLKGFVENEKKIKNDFHDFPANFEEINEQIELKKFENSKINNYLLNDEQNLNILNQSKNIKKKNSALPLTSRYSPNKSNYLKYRKVLTEPNLQYEPIKEKKIEEINHITNSFQKDNKNTNIKKLVNLKLNPKKEFSRNSTNNNLSNYTTSFKSYSISDNRKNIFKNIEKKVSKHNSVLITRNNLININNSKEYKSFEFKTTKQLIEQIINDGFIIDNHIKSHRLILRKKEKTDKEKILLKLEERLKFIRNKKYSIKKKKKKLTNEEYYKQKIDSIPDFAKKFFNEIYSLILFEDRVLCKNDEYKYSNALEALIQRNKLNKEIKKEVIKRMKIANDFFVSDKDDKKLIEEQKKSFDFYGNLDGLEWLIMKKNLIQYNKKFH